MIFLYLSFTWVLWVICGVLADKLAIKKGIFTANPKFDFYYILFILHGPIVLIKIYFEPTRK